MLRKKQKILFHELKDIKNMTQNVKEHKLELEETKKWDDTLKKLEIKEKIISERKPKLEGNKSE